MKRCLLLLIVAICCAIKCFSQDEIPQYFDMDNHINFTPNKAYVIEGKDYIVISDKFSGMRKDSIYNIIHEHIVTAFPSAKITEHEPTAISIRIEGTIWLEEYGYMNVMYGFELVIRIKDGKIRIDKPNYDKLFKRTNTLNTNIWVHNQWVYVYLMDGGRLLETYANMYIDYIINGKDKNW